MKDIASGTDKEIFGKLGSVSLNDIIQLLGMSKRTATLELTCGSEHGRVYFRDGQIVHASAGSYEGEESLFELLSWGDAEFAVEEGIVSLPKISITRSTDALLLSTMTALDEIARVTPGRAIGVAPSIIKKRAPRRPRPRPVRSFSRRHFLLLGGLAIVACGSFVGLFMTPSIWAETSWHDLPAVDAPPGLGDGRQALAVPEAWVTATAVWSRPAPPRAASEPTARAPVQGPGYLIVVVEPWARIEIDGAAAGETPLGRLELSAGTHRITLSNDHIVGVIRDEVVIASGESVTRRYSFNDTGTLRVVVTPWADVSVDGRSIGQTPLGRVAVPAGAHSLRFVHPELGVTERDVIVVSGQTAIVKVQLR